MGADNEIRIQKRLSTALVRPNSKFVAVIVNRTYRWYPFATHSFGDTCRGVLHCAARASVFWAMFLQYINHMPFLCFEYNRNVCCICVCRLDDLQSPVCVLRQHVRAILRLRVRVQLALKNISACSLQPRRAHRSRFLPYSVLLLKIVANQHDQFSACIWAFCHASCQSEFFFFFLVT